MPRLQAALAARFPSIRFTRQLVTAAIGIEAGPFANCLAWMETDQDYATLHAATKEIEQQLGSTREDRREGRVVADADILCCGGCRSPAAAPAAPAAITPTTGSARTSRHSWLSCLVDDYRDALSAAMLA